MRLTAAAALLAALPTGLAAPTAPKKFCDASGICYTEYSNSQDVTYRIAIPDTAKAAPFDILISIVAPKAVGWAAIAWGGTMANNPLTVAWANGATSVVSSRRATGHTLPGAYTGASYTVLPGSTSNSTHWTLTALCSGCSQWTDANSKTVSLDPSSTSAGIAQAMSTSAPAEPASNASRISIHQSHTKITADLNAAKIANFTTLVAAAMKAA